MEEKLFWLHHENPNEEEIAPGIFRRRKETEFVFEKDKGLLTSYEVKRKIDGLTYNIFLTSNKDN